MSDVFLATSNQKEFHEQFLAIKKLLPHLNSNRPFVNLLVHEAKIGVLLTHPCIATVFDLGSHQSEFFLAMEYIHGKSLDRVLSLVLKDKAPPLPLDLSCFIIIEVLRGLAFAHQLKDVKNRDLNIVHRDLTPGNILMSYLGEVKIADFGIATAENRLQPGFTSTAMGKVAYIAPEQALNDPTVRASDIYSIGVVFHQLLTGHLPYQGNTPNEIFKKVIQGQVTEKLSGKVPDSLRALILRCLSRSTKDRPQSCPDFFNELNQIAIGEFDSDFTFKTVRLEYQKKISEYMRKVFSSDISEELAITKRALSQSFITQPTDPMNPNEVGNADFGVEVTVYEADISNEHTRHYPIDEISRQKMLREVENDRAERIQQPGSDAFAQEPTKATELDSDPESESIARSISVEKKLSLSKLSRDEKENLKDQQPAIEITSSDALQEFESKTFVDTRQETKTKAAGEITNPPVARDEQGGFVETTKPAAGAPQAPRRRAERDLSRERDRPRKKDAPQERKFSFVVTVRSSIAMVKPWLETGRKVILYGSILLVTAWALFLAGKKITTPAQPWKGNLRKESRIFLQFIGEASQQQLLTMTSTIKDPTTTPNLSEVENFYSREYKRYSGVDLKIVTFELSHYPISMFDGLTKQSNVLQLLTSNAIFTFLKQKGAEGTTNYDATVYVYFYPFESDHPNLSFPDEFAGEHSSREGVIFAPAHLSQRLRVLQSIAREVAKIYGATDKIDAVTKMPLIPSGIANPKASSLYPQSKAELMGKDIPTSPIQKRSITSMSEVIIGPDTAYELGWINRATRDKLVR